MQNKDQPVISDIIFDTVTQKFSFFVPEVICDNLLIFYNDNKGVFLCHQDRRKLSAFRQILIRQNNLTDTRNQSMKKRGSVKTGAAVFLLCCMVLFAIFDHNFLKDNPGYKWPLYIGSTVIIMLCLYTIITNYLVPGITGNNLDRQLSLIEIHKRISEEFRC